jgi:transcriptional regulator GlxA family with amidase domain
MLIQIVLFEGFDDLDAIGPYEVLVNAAKGGADVSVELVTLAPVRGPVTSSHGARIEPHGVLGEPDLLLVPGGGWNDRAAEGARAQAERGELPRAVAEHHARGAQVASVCTGGGILAASGVVDDRPFATHRAAREELRGRGFDVRDDRVVDDGDVVTAAGVTSGIDLALHLVEREWGARLAEDVAREMEFERRGSVHAGPNAR